MQEQRQNVQEKIERTEALFEKNLDLLKQQYREAKQSSKAENYSEGMYCREMEKAVTKRKLEEVDLMKLLWEQ